MSIAPGNGDANRRSAPSLGDVAGRRIEAAKLPDAFERFWDLGYRRLLPVVPPSANIQSAGKRPGLKKGSTWSGLAARAFDAKAEDCLLWAQMGAGVGLRCDAGLLGVDIDTKSPTHAKLIADIALDVLGPAKPRIGNAPKALLSYRGDGAMTYRQFRFDDGVDPSKPGLVEFLAGPDKWFVADGIHPVTNKPYTWPQGVPAYDELTIVREEEVDKFFEMLSGRLSGFRGASSSVDREKVDQNSLKGDPAQLRRAMEALPNDPSVIGYNEWVRIAAGLRGACQDDPALGLELFEDWTEKAQIGEETESAYRVYHSLDAPFGLGASFIYSEATRLTGGTFNADLYYEKRNDGLFPQAADANPATRFDFAAAARIDQSRLEAIPDRDYVLGSRFQAGTLTLGAGPAGVSKSTFAIKSALAIATGKPLTGETVAKCGRILIYNAEDPRDEIMRRVMATARLDGLELGDVLDRVRILSGYDDRRLVFAERTQRGGTIRPGADLDDLIAFVTAEDIVHVALDPLVALHRGLEENAAADMEALGDQLRRFAQRTGASVDLIHHTAKNRTGQADANAGSADAARGSGAVVGFVRSAYTLVPMGGRFGEELALGPERIAQMVRLDDAKRNYARRSARERWFEIVSVLPSGQLVPASDFEARDEAVRRRAENSTGVHVPFDVTRQRALAAVSRADDDDVQRAAMLAFIASSMDTDIVSRTEIVDRFGAAMSLKETMARARVDSLVPIEKSRAVEVEVDGSRFAIWRENQKRGSTRKWMLRREWRGQIVLAKASNEASSEENGSVFD